MAWPLKMGLIGCSEISVNNYQRMLHNFTEEWRFPVWLLWIICDMWLVWQLQRVKYSVCIGKYFPYEHLGLDGFSICLIHLEQLLYSILLLVTPFCMYCLGMIHFRDTWNSCGLQEDSLQWSSGHCSGRVLQADHQMTCKDQGCFCKWCVVH